MSRIWGPVRQNGYVVCDVEAAMKYWTEVVGVGPFFYFETVPIDWFRHRGEAQEPHLSIAMANSGDMQIELIQQHNDAPSMYLEFMDAHGEGLQHMSFWSTQYQTDYDAALARGLTVGQEGQIGGEQGRFVYFDTDARPGVILPPQPGGAIIELSDISGVKAQFFEHIRKSAVDWDGADPIRPVGATP